MSIAALAVVPVAQAADIIGTITLKGTPPPEVPYTPLMNDPTCGAMYKTAPTTHFYVVGPNHELADVIVSLKGVTGKSTGASQPPVCWIKRAVCIRPKFWPFRRARNWSSKIPTPASTTSTACPTVAGNPESNQVQMPGGPDLTYTFPKPEMFMKFKCDVHPWMFAWVSVFDSPYYCLSDTDGKFVIKNVPPGKYTVEADHRKLGTQTKDVEVKDSDVTVNFTFDVK